jgi:anti-anti-sigma factor
MIPQTRPSERGPILVVDGELDIASTVTLEADLALAESARPPVIVLDLRPLTFIDLHGLDAIIAAHGRAGAQRRRLVCIVPAAGIVRRLFELTGVIDLIEIAKDDSERTR